MPIQPNIFCIVGVGAGVLILSEETKKSYWSMRFEGLLGMASVFFFFLFFLGGGGTLWDRIFHFSSHLILSFSFFSPSFLDAAVFTRQELPSQEQSNNLWK
jgi:hypothetical protein